MAAFIDAQGQTQQVTLDVTMYRAAGEAGMTLPQYINANFPVAAGAPSAWEQILASEGIFVKPDREFGIRATTMEAMLNGQIQAGAVVKDAVPTSRILFPAVILSAIENKMMANMAMTPNAFEQMVAVDDTITGDRYERPVLDFSKPEAGRSAGIAQLAEPQTMMTLTTSDIARKIPTFSLGLMVSEQALRATTLDFVAMSIARQNMVERHARTNEQILMLLNGDTDMGYAALSTLSGKVVRANTLDAGITASGNLSQKAWMKWLFRNSTKRTITHIITDIDTALAIENRSGKPTVQTDNPNSVRLDTLFQVMNPTWPGQVKLFLTDDANWPANTILGIDASAAIHRVTSTNASYQAIEQFVLRRAQALRFDFGFVVDRLFNDAYEVLELIV